MVARLSGNLHPGYNPTNTSAEVTIDGGSQVRDQSIVVRIFHPSPLLTGGLRRLLEKANHTARELDELDPDPPDVVVIADDYELLGELRRRYPSTAVVVMVEGEAPTEFQRAYAGGGAGVIVSNWDEDRVLATIEGAAAGMPAVPVDVIQYLATRSDADPTTLTDVELAVLKGLARGATIQSIADAIGYSERETHRIISRLLKYLGASNRAEALVRATQIGLIPD